MKNLTALVLFKVLKKGVFCVDYAHKSDLVAYCGGDGTIQLASIHEKYAGRGSVKKESNSLMG